MIMIFGAGSGAIGLLGVMVGCLIGVFKNVKTIILLGLIGLFIGAFLDYLLFSTVENWLLGSLGSSYKFDFWKTIVIIDLILGPVVISVFSILKAVLWRNLT